LARGAARRDCGVLTSLQERVACIVAGLPEADGFALAGGAALVVMHVVDRATRDLDFFGPSAGEVDRLVPAVESALSAAGFEVRRERASHGFARLTIVDGGDVTEVDLAADARIRPVDDGPLGPTLSLEELAADKLLALFDRAQARDFVDVAALVERFGLGRLCELASEKDSGFSRSVLVDMLGSFRRFPPGEFGLSADAYENLARSVEDWRLELTAGARPIEPGAPEVEL
jgi:hypothetical protein